MDIDITISLSKRQCRLLADIGNAKGVPRAKDLWCRRWPKRGLRIARGARDGRCHLLAGRSFGN